MKRRKRRVFRLPRRRGESGGIDFSRWNVRRPMGRSLFWLGLVTLLVLLLLQYLRGFIK